MLTEGTYRIRETLIKRGYRIHHGHWGIQIWRSGMMIAEAEFPVGCQGPVDTSFTRELAYKALLSTADSKTVVCPHCNLDNTHVHDGRGYCEDCDAEWFR